MLRLLTVQRARRAAALVALVISSLPQSALGSDPLSPGITLETAEAAPSMKPPSPTTWAVLIGLNDDGISEPLVAAEADINSADQALARVGVPAANRLVLTGKDVNADRIRRSLAWLVTNARPQDTAVFLYAGHVHKLSPGIEAVATIDGSVLDAELATALEGLRARHTWLVMAGCYGGGFDELLGPGRVLTAAASAQSLAYENVDLGNSYLVEYVFDRGLEAGRTVDAMVAAASSDLANDHPDRLPLQLGDGSFTLRHG